VSLPGSPPWSAASAPIWSRVAGYSWPARCDKPLAFIRAFFDDSAAESGDRRLFIAGYINRAESWALFSDAWDEELRATPSIEYLKMSEAQNLGGQFDHRRGWDEGKRAEKLRGLVRVIRHFEPLSFQISVDREFFYRVYSPVSPRGLANPYFDCIAATVATVADFGARAKFESPIEFIFDKQDGVEDDISMFFAQMVPRFRKRVRNMIDGTPKFVDDKAYRPIQAADMLAWHLRREHENSVSLPMADELRGIRGHLVTEIPNSLVQSWADHNNGLPGVEGLRSKRQWSKFKASFARQVAAGANPATLGRPPLLWRAQNRMRHLLARLRRKYSGNN
jgi:hypothetical protein